MENLTAISGQIFLAVSILAAGAAALYDLHLNK